jgi:hypothetical protein
MLTCAVAALFVGVLVAAGCGGGGPHSPQVAALTTAAQFKALLPTGQKSATPVGAAACKPCHAADCKTQALTRHAAISVDCEACHGPGSAHVAAKGGLTNILNGPQSLSTAVCGQCHADIVSDYNTSAHAQVITDAVSTTAASSTCLRCHSDVLHTLDVEAPQAQNPPLTPTQIDTAITGIAQTTLNTYAVATVHTVACAGCHDPHQNTQYLDSAGNQFYLRAKTSNTDLSSDPPNATVAQYTTVNQVCGMCHNNRGGDPSDAGLTKNTSRPATHEGPEYNMLNGYGGNEDPAGPSTRTSSHVNAPDQCITCHMPTVNGSVRHTFTVSLDVSCAPCHTPTDAAARETTVQTEITNGLAALETRMRTQALKLFGDANDWDYTTNIVSPSVAPTQSKVPLAMKRARHNYYFILLDRSFGVHNIDYTTYLLNWSNTNLDTVDTTLGISTRAATTPLSRQQVLSMLNANLAKMKSTHASQ